MTERKEKSTDEFSAEVAKQESRKALAKKKGIRSIWFGFGTFGLIGWSVVTPMLLGIVIGVWVDRHYTSKYSWTLTLLIGGLMLGCFNAWHWINKENEQIKKEQEEQDE